MKLKVKEKMVDKIVKVNSVRVKHKAIGTFGGETKFSSQVLLVLIGTDDETYEIILKRDDIPDKFSLDDEFAELVLEKAFRLLDCELVKIDSFKDRLVLELTER